MGAVEKPRKVTTKEFDNMDFGDDRAELIDGEVVLMGQPSVKHRRLQTRISSIIDNLNNQNPKSGGPKGPSISVLTEAYVKYGKNRCIHDVAGFKDISEGELDAMATPISIVPFWVCEVISPSSIIMDNVSKKNILSTYKVPYYWIVDPNTNTIACFKYLVEIGVYDGGSVFNYKKGTRSIPPFFDLKIDLKQLFGVE